MVDPNLPKFDVRDSQSGYAHADFSSLRQYHRELNLDIERVNRSARTVEASLSSEHPVLRNYGYEVLSHTDEAINLERAIDNQLPLLMAHKHDEVVGKVENIRLYDGKLRGRLKFSKSARGEEALQDVADGILRAISIGYMIDEVELSRNERGEVYKATRWTPYEISVLGVPADHTVGIGRQLEAGVIERGENSELIKRQNEIIELYKRHSESMQYAKRDALAKLLNEIGNDATRSMQEARDGLLAAISSEGAIATDYIYDKRKTVMEDKVNFQNYSLSRAFLAAAGDRSVDAGFEIEVSQEMARQSGKRSAGLMVPFEALQQRAITGAGSGQYMVDTVLRPEAFIEVLRPRSIIMSLGVTMLDGLVGNVAIPRQATSSTAAWLDLDGTDTITESTPTYDQVTLTMKSIAALTSFTHKMLKQGTPGIERLVRDDLARVLGTALDVAAIQGTGLNDQPTGVVNQSGINTFVAATPTYEDVVNMEAYIADDNAHVNNMAYITTPTIAMAFKTTEKASGTAQFVWEDNPDGSGRMNGKRAYYTKNVPTGNIILGNWSDMLVGQWGGLELAADGGGSNFNKGNISVRAIMDTDFAVRHPVSFCVTTPA